LFAPSTLSGQREIQTCEWSKVSQGLEEIEMGPVVVEEDFDSNEAAVEGQDAWAEERTKRHRRDPQGGPLKSNGKYFFLSLTRSEIRRRVLLTPMSRSSHGLKTIPAKRAENAAGGIFSGVLKTCWMTGRGP
jgi:hypothetical protein